MAVIDTEIKSKDNNNSSFINSQGKVSSSGVAVLALIPSQTIIASSDLHRKKISSSTGTTSVTPVSSLLHLVPSQSIHSISSHQKDLCPTHVTRKGVGGVGHTFSQSLVRKNSYALLMADLDDSDDETDQQDNHDDASLPTTSVDDQILVVDNIPTITYDNLQPPKTVARNSTIQRRHHPITSQSKKKKLKKKKQKRNKPSFANHGDIPDVYWRAIPMEHLRSHPLYVPLPHPDTIRRIHSLEQVRTFRQDSWQWDELHRGRCTTSQAAPALGFLEPHAAKVLGIPRSLQNGCMGAFERLRQPALRTLEDMNRILTTGGNGGDKKLHQVWKDMDESGVFYPFAAKYLPCVSLEEMCRRKKEASRYVRDMSSHMRIRMSWGNCQEATAILTALNYFARDDRTLKVKEVGMCGAGLDVNELVGKSTSLLVGASPDSVIEYSDGTLEVLEVKNHCPFVPSEWIKSSKKKPGKYRIRELPLQASVPAAYVPQLMMEMLCCGDNCRSAIMVRQTATSGAIILRIRRDDEWIKEMMYWLQRFTDNYINKNEPPPQNFFWEGDEESKRYRSFVNRTKAISEEVELVEHVRNNDIQRMLGENGLCLPLFLDQIES